MIYRDKKKEYLVCLYLNARNVLIKKKQLVLVYLIKVYYTQEKFFIQQLRIIIQQVLFLIHNHPSGDLQLQAKKTLRLLKKYVQAGEIMGIAVLDFIITANNGSYSFYEKFKD